jgi:hypothetical protein
MLPFETAHAFKSRGEFATFFAIPKGVVLVISLLAAISFLVEGALLDWSALLLVGERLLSPARGGLGYMLFSTAMIFSRPVSEYSMPD